MDSKKAKKQKLFSKVDDLQKIDIPIVSFIEGYALGGGFELALSSDLIIASSEAKFGLPEINLGLIIMRELDSPKLATMLLLPTYSIH